MAHCYSESVRNALKWIWLRQPHRWPWKLKGVKELSETRLASVKRYWVGNRHIYPSRLEAWTCQLVIGRWAGEVSTHGSFLLEPVQETYGTWSWCWWKWSEAMQTHVERMVLTIERPMTTNAREPNMRRIILLQLNTAYALKPHTARGQSGQDEDAITIKSIRLERRGNRIHSLIMPIRPKTLRIVQIRYHASQLYV